jgi:HTH-type transcriptional regulator/antitoxin HigA
MAQRRPARPIIRPLRCEADYDAALVAIARYFDKPPKPGTSAADRFDRLALVIEEYERKRWPIEPLAPAARTARSRRSTG